MTNSLRLTNPIIWLKEVFSTPDKFKISQQKDGAGNDLWKVYDASINRTVYLKSEEELRIWIEESFYRSHKESELISSFDLYQQRRFF
ncbi:hypothetical protein H6G36_26950 [Anabaena minutissima FACHB-250]|nr:hypothetical protein [Anabaena minutissima FACHB-250]